RMTSKSLMWRAAISADGKRRCTRTLPPLITPGRVGATKCPTVSSSLAAIRTVSTYSAQSAMLADSSKCTTLTTLNIGKSFDVGGLGGHRPRTLGDVLIHIRPPPSEFGVSSSLPGHVPPRVHAVDRPHDGDHVGFVV